MFFAICTFNILKNTPNENSKLAKLTGDIIIRKENG